MKPVKKPRASARGVGHWNVVIFEEHDGAADVDCTTAGAAARATPPKITAPAPTATHKEPAIRKNGLRMIFYLFFILSGA